jgi:flagellar hook-basal body complex protein FliE
MSIEAIGAIGAASALGSAVKASGAAAADKGVFAGILEQVSAMNDRFKASEQNVQALALGQTDSLHQIMMQGEETRLAFELMLQVRNKTLDAYQELMRMQI